MPSAEHADDARPPNECVSFIQTSTRRADGSDVNRKDLQTAIVDAIKADNLAMIAELVKLDKLRKA